MNIITAIENKKINEQLKNIKNINILNSDIQYKEGISCTIASTSIFTQYLANYNV